VLLSSTSTPATRTLAARQLAALAKGHPEELPTLLEKLHPLVRSSQWEIRGAAVEALEQILESVLASQSVAAEEFIKKEEVKREQPNEDEEDDFAGERAPEEGEAQKVKQENGESQRRGKNRVPLRFSTFDLGKMLAEDDGLAATRSQDMDDGSGQAVDIERQKSELNKQLGLDVAAKLGMATGEIVCNEDLESPARPRMKSSRSSSSSTSTSPTPTASAAAAPRANGSSSMSARERNRLKRTMAKEKQRQIASAKRSKLAPKLYKAPKSSCATSSFLSAVREFSEFLLADLFDRKWEVRHGAASALREVARLHGARLEATEAWLENAALSLLSVVARDRFGDFVSDAVVAPVRESASQALGAVVGCMSADDVNATVNLLLRLLDEDNWQCRHGGLLGVS
jgi:TATA-binding protein-associated factor